MESPETQPQTTDMVCTGFRVNPNTDTSLATRTALKQEKVSTILCNPLGVTQVQEVKVEKKGVITISKQEVRLVGLLIPFGENHSLDNTMGKNPDVEKVLVKHSNGNLVSYWLLPDAIECYLLIGSVPLDLLGDVRRNPAAPVNLANYGVISSVLDKKGRTMSQVFIYAPQIDPYRLLCIGGTGNNSGAFLNIIKTVVALAAKHGKQPFQYRARLTRGDEQTFRGSIDPTKPVKVGEKAPRVTTTGRMVVLANDHENPTAVEADFTMPEADVAMVSALLPLAQEKAIQALPTVFLQIELKKESARFNVVGITVAATKTDRDDVVIVAKDSNWSEKVYFFSESIKLQASSALGSYAASTGILSVPCVVSGLWERNSSTWEITGITVAHFAILANPV